ncbi:MAG: hypothetical protein MJK12_21195 [Colwellia sp.]|nr:hypothetical protein [Colwellia sp.]
MGKLTALVPPLRLNLTRFYGVFTPDSNTVNEVTAALSNRFSRSVRRVELTNSGPRLRQWLSDVSVE